MTRSGSEPDPRAAIEALAGCTSPWLFGVRHHSPACALALPALLDALAPTVLAVELPADLAHWIPWLAAPDAVAPLAVAAVTTSGEDLGFYPFADFSPELVALRWARARGVPAHAIDLPAARRADYAREAHARAGIAARLRGADDDSWEAMVEAAAPGQTPEAVRRAALLYGWALRVDAAHGSGIGERDLAREAHMREALAALAVGGARVAAVIGSFHAAALLPAPTLWSPPPPRAHSSVALVSSLIPYAFELLDARSGYPAGIRDPQWHQRLWQTLGDAGDTGALVATCLVEITRDIRARGLPASVPDARAATELAMALASLRGHAAPGRRELVEAVQTALAQGELLGRGRVVARAMERVLVGRARGRLAPATPRSGLAPHVAALMAELRLPFTAMTEPEDTRLDPSRSRLDRRRHVALGRLRACGVPYATEIESQGVVGLETLTTVWRLMATPATEAVIELAGTRGVTLRQAAIGALRAERARLAADGTLGVATLLALTAAAAEAGAGPLVNEGLGELTGPRLADATLAELIGVIALVDRIAAGHVVALPPSATDAVLGEVDVFEPDRVDRIALLGAAVASVLGLAGSTALTDARALAELVRVLERPEHDALGDSRLRWSIGQLVATGTPLIAGAASVIQVLIGTHAADALAVTLGGWTDAAVDGDSCRTLASRLRGALAVAGPLFESAPVFLESVHERVAQLADADFLARAAALREGFETLSTASRRRLLVALGERLGQVDGRGIGLDVTLEIPATLLLAAAEADAAGRAAIAGIPGRTIEPRASASPAAAPVTVQRTSPDHAIPIADRWRLILGHEREQMRPRSQRAARALDELYGRGHGEGSRGDPGGGGDAAYPTVRAWRDEIEELFGTPVFEQVAAQAALQGRAEALLQLDPASITPSVELLERVLSLKGGLGEGQLGRLRALVRRIVDELVRELAVRVRPALQGAQSSRATRRPTGALHLPRTVSANLGHARITEHGVQLVPETLIFRARSRRHLDWQVVIVVDVSGSMEPSVIYSALMSAILSAVPWVDVKFVAFSTEIVDLSAHAADPLGLLLEVSVGGGTHIGKGLAYARSLVHVPQRTIVLLVTDFEEGVSVEHLLGEVRALVESGVIALGLAALDDRGAPRYAVPIAEQVAAAGMPVAALSPTELARWIGEKIR